VQNEVKCEEDDADEMNRKVKREIRCRIVMLFYCVADIQTNGCPWSLAYRFIFQSESTLLLGWWGVTTTERSNNGNNNRLRCAPASIPRNLRLVKVCIECVKSRTNFMKQYWLA